MRSIACLLVTAGSFALAACSGSDPIDLPPAGGAPITIEGWPVGTTGVVRLHGNSAWGAPLGEFPIDANGRFVYSLGVPDGLMAFNTTAGATVSPPDARYQVVLVAMTLLAGDASPTGELHVANRLIHAMPGAGDTVGELFYVDRDVTITGAAEGCTYDQRFREGWNYSLMHVTAVEPFACTYSSSPGLPVGLNWHYEYLGL